MKIKKTVSLTILVVFLLLLALASSASAADTPWNPFAEETTTAAGYPTWDSDMINIEAVTQTGADVYVAVLDSGMVPYWTDYFPEERVAIDLAKGFYQQVIFKQKNEDPCGVEVEVGQLHEVPWIGSRGTTHGTHVASTVLGYFYRSNTDVTWGFDLGPIMVRGIAPDVTVIPVKVLADYQIPAFPFCEEGIAPSNAVFGTSAMVAAGIDYATDLAIEGYRPMVINMSLGGPELEEVEKAAIDRAVANGVIVVASAGNEGGDGMGYPGAYPPVISTGATGWTKEWLDPATEEAYYRMWWLQSDLAAFIDLPEENLVDEVYVTDFSSRELDGQELDVLAPGSWVRGPFPGWPGYSHLPWWSKGIGDVMGANPGNFYYVGGTSMSAPHVTGLAALMLEKNPNLVQADIESILKDTALPIPPGYKVVWDLITQGDVEFTWDIDATGAGLIQADAALEAVPLP